MNICICGGGNLGHVITGFLASKGDNEVNLLTRHPERWAGELLIHTPDEGDLYGRVHRISSNPAEVVRGAGIVLLCLPGYSIANVLQEIRADIVPGTIVGSVVSSTGFFDVARQLLPADTPLFGFQRVPFIARTEVYGHSATLMGRKPQLSIGMMGIDNPEAFARRWRTSFSRPPRHSTATTRLA